MDLRLERARADDSKLIHAMQLSGFRALLEKYRDYDTSPGAATLEHVRQRLSADSFCQRGLSSVFKKKVA